MRTKDLQRNKTWWEGEVYVDEITPGVEGRQIITLKLPSGETITGYYWYNDNVEMELDIYRIGDDYYRVRYKNEHYECSPTKRPENEPVVMAKTDDYWHKVNLGKCRHGILCAYIQSAGLEPFMKDKKTDKFILKLVNELAEFSMTGEIE